jgi:hypothetical protein
MCNVQTFDVWSESLRITAQRGFQPRFLPFFERVWNDGSACGVAMGRGEMVEVEDVTTSPIFCGTPALDVMLESDVRAVVSMPSFDPTGPAGGRGLDASPRAGPPGTARVDASPPRGGASRCPVLTFLTWRDQTPSSASSRFDWMAPRNAR